jgi:hypothetical protein
MLSVGDLTPLCPAALPLKGGERQVSRFMPLSDDGMLGVRQKRGAVSAPHPLSPLEGEMPGRAEGGVREVRSCP